MIGSTGGKVDGPRSGGVRVAAMTDEQLPLVAYYHGRRPGMRIVPSGRWRTWMNETTGRGANRCLPLLVANESGWVLLNERRFSVSWTGGTELEAVRVDYAGRKPELPALSNFGHGILTFPIPYLFRTPPGWDLWVRGPTNRPRDGIAPLDGVVETEWATTTFTMNWQFTRPCEDVVFEEDDPICMVVPFPRRALERFDPSIEPVEREPELAARWEAWRKSRHDLQVRKWLAAFHRGDDALLSAWQPDYFRGEIAEGERFPDHVTKLRLEPFDDDATESGAEL
jgi:Family of unknown function (DUF6065)